MHTHPVEDDFEALLQRLDPADRDGAGLRHEELRETLIRFFRWRRCEWPEELADETMTRVAKKVAAGEAIVDVARFALGVARLVALEQLKDEHRRQTALRNAATLAFAEPVDEGRLACLDACLSNFPAEDRSLIVAYYAGECQGRIVNRRRLAEDHSLSLAALRVRAHRLRERLERCIEHGLAGRAMK